MKWDQLIRCYIQYSVLQYTPILDTLGTGISSLARLGRHPMTVMGIQSFGLDSFRKCIEFEVCWSLQVIWCDLLSGVQLTSFLRSIYYFLLHPFRLFVSLHLWSLGCNWWTNGWPPPVVATSVAEDGIFQRLAQSMAANPEARACLEADGVDP